MWSRLIFATINCCYLLQACKAKLNPLENILSRISELLTSPVSVDMTTPIHRSSVKLRLDSSSVRSRIVSPPVINDSTPDRGSEDLRFISTKSLNLQPPTPQSSISSTVSPPLKSSHYPASTATMPSRGNSRHRPSQRDQVPPPKPQRYQSTDAFVLTTPDVSVPPDVISSMSASSILTSSRRADEKAVDEDWQRMVAAASSDQINLVSFHNNNDTTSTNSADSAPYTSRTVPRNSATRKTNNSGTVIFTLEASPPVKGRSTGVTLRSTQDVCVTTASPDSSPKPLSFANPLYSHGTKADMSQRRRPAAATEVKSNVPSSAWSNNSGSYRQYSTRDVASKRPQALTLATGSVGVGRSRKYRELAGSTESLDSVLATRPAAKHRSPIETSLEASSRFSQSASHIERHPTPVRPQRPPRGNLETTPPATLADRGVEHRESNFGALKRLWQSIELPTSPSTSTGSSRSYQSPVRMPRSHIVQQLSGKHQHSASFDAGLSDFGSVSGKSARRGHSCDSLLTESSKTQQQKENRNQRGLSIDVEDQSEVHPNVLVCVGL